MVAEARKNYYATVGPIPGSAVGPTVMTYEERGIKLVDVLYVGVGVPSHNILPITGEQQSQPLYALLIVKEMPETTLYVDFLKGLSQ